MLHRLADGTPMGVASLRKLHAALSEVHAVVRSGDDTLRMRLEAEGIPVHDCPDAMLGMVWLSKLTLLGASGDERILL